jgi:hypothetical protein
LFVFLKTAEESAFTQNADTTLFSRGVIDGEILLGEFEKWIKTQKVINRDTFMNKDHYMLLTAYVLLFFVFVLLFL